MADLEHAKNLASFVRLSEDIENPKADSQKINSRAHHKDHMLRNGVLLSETVTPVLEKRLLSVCNVLEIPRRNVTAFVYNSADIQADCLIDTAETCVLRFTSGLVNLMNEKEFQFVIGHELGHFLLGHGACLQNASEGSSEDYMRKRAAELSADRIGFLSIGSIEESVQAIIKIASGLSDQFLRFDVSGFLSQIDMISNSSPGESKNNTHPSMLIRCRSLLWFSMSIQSLDDVVKSNERKIRGVDVRVTKDLEKFVDGQIRLKKIELKHDIVLWKSAVLIFHSGSFSKEVQLRLSANLGEEALRGIKSFFNLFSREEILEEISQRLRGSLSSLHQEFPESAEETSDAAYKVAYKIVETE